MVKGARVKGRLLACIVLYRFLCRSHAMIPIACKWFLSGISSRLRGSFNMVVIPRFDRFAVVSNCMTGIAVGGAVRFDTPSSRIHTLSTPRPSIRP